MIVKVEKRDDPYARIDNRALNDERISYRARGVLAYLLSKPNGWKAQTSDIVAHGTEGRDAIRSVFRELRHYGYAAFRTVAGGGSEWTIYEIPSREPENPSLGEPEKPTVGKSDTINKREEETKELSLSDGAEAIVDFSTENKARPRNLEQVIAYAEKIGVSADDAEGFFDSEVGGGWKRNGKAIADWRACLRTWKRYGWLPSQKKKHDTYQKPHSESNRNVGTANEGKSSQYKGVGRLKGVQDSE
jgi:hypothetical protein